MCVCVCLSVFVCRAEEQLRKAALSHGDLIRFMEHCMYKLVRVYPEGKRYAFRVCVRVRVSLLVLFLPIQVQRFAHCTKELVFF